MIINGECLETMRGMADNSVDSVVTDPPYGLSFMGKKWDYDVPSVEIWQECLRVLKPGGFLLSFAGTRTQHRMAVNIEDAGFEIRDMIAWVYGSGFPKSHNIGKAVDKRGGKQILWFGEWLRNWRKENSITQKEVAKLFPSKTGRLTGCVANWELGLNMPTNDQFNLICKTFDLPFQSLEEAEREVVGSSNNGIAGGSGEFTAGNKKTAGFKGSFNITTPATEQAKQWEGWGTALKPALEPITVARKPFKGTVAENVLKHGTGGINVDGCRVGDEDKQGRFPANLIHDGSDEVVDIMGDKQRFFYCAKASKKDRNEGCEGMEEKRGGSLNMRTDTHSQKNGMDTGLRANNHPTVKPTKLMRYLCRLVTQPGGVILDPFMGSGSTGKAARLEGFDFIGIEMDEEYCKIAEARINHGHNNPT